MTKYRLVKNGLGVYSIQYLGQRHLPDGIFYDEWKKRNGPEYVTKDEGLKALYSIREEATLSEERYEAEKRIEVVEE